MKSSLRGRVKNVVLAKASGLLPLFEAVVNSIQAIEDRFTSGDAVSKRGEINIRIRREDDQPQMDLNPGRRPERPIIAFEIEDNGVGFNNENWASFQELDFTLKTKRGCRGVGRLTWLKAFSKVRGESWYDDAGSVKGRFFQFTAENEDQQIDLPENTPIGEIGSKIILESFRSTYAQSVEKTADAIASRVRIHNQ